MKSSTQDRYNVENKVQIRVLEQAYLHIATHEENEKEIKRKKERKKETKKTEVGRRKTNESDERMKEEISGEREKGKKAGRK
jgi:hypothetical protein